MVNQDVILTLAEIKDRLGELYGAYFSDAHDYFLSKYSALLGKGLIKNVQKLETKKGVFIIIDYSADSQKQYHAVALIDSNRAVKEQSFDLLGSQKKDAFAADAAIRAALGDKLKNYFIYQVKLDADTYTFDYMNSTFDNIRVVVNRNDLDSTNLITKMSVNSFGLTNLVMEDFYQTYPEYKGFSVTNTVKNDEYYVLSLGPSLSLSFAFKDFRFLVNKPYFAPMNVILPLTSQNGQPMVGGYNSFTNYTDTVFLSAVQMSAKEFPDLIGAQVTKVYSQVVAGMNYIIFFKKVIPSTSQFDQYETRVYCDLQGSAKMFEAKKNGQYIYNINYNYNDDPTFFSQYKIVAASSNVTNIPPIESVFYKNSGAKKYYKVNYSAK